MVHRDAELNRRRREWVHFPEAVLDFGRWEIERGVKGSSRPVVVPAAWGAPAAARVARFIAKARQPPYLKGTRDEADVPQRLDDQAHIDPVERHRGLERNLLGLAPEVRQEGPDAEDA